MPEYHVHDDFRRHFEQNGVPQPLPDAIRQAFATQGMTPPVMRQQIAVVTPPHVGDGNPDLVDADGQIIEPGGPRCVHCGRLVGEDDNLALHAVAGAEDATDANGRPLRLLVRHCENCVGSDHCDPNVTSPGSGYPNGHGSAGFCEFLNDQRGRNTAAVSETGTRLSAMILPLPPSLLDRLAFELSRWTKKLRDLILQAITTSQGQQQSTLKGDTGAIGAQGDSTSGHGYNVGAIRVYTGAAPATANAAETGTKLADVALPNPCFGAPSAALPSVLTANAISNSTILATGTAGYGRLVTNTSTGVPTAEDGTLSTTQRRIMFAVGTSGSDMNFNTLSLVSGGTLSVTSMTITHGS